MLQGEDDPRPVGKPLSPSKSPTSGGLLSPGGRPATKPRKSTSDYSFFDYSLIPDKMEPAKRQKTPPVKDDKKE